MSKNEPILGWTWNNLYDALRDMVVGPQFLKQLINHSGIHMKQVAKTYRYGSFDVVEMKNGDTYWIKFSIREQKATNE